MRTLFLFLALLCSAFVSAQVTLSGSGNFILSSPTRQAAVVYDSSDPVLLGKVAGLFADDVQRVSGRRPEIAEVRNGKVSLGSKARDAVIVATVESPLIKKMSKRGILNANGLAGTWERYHVELVAHPLQGVSKALVIVGSDRRGAAYGLLSISRAMGVHPWYFWMDVPVKQRKEIRLAVSTFTSKSPSVKYRGIFINDEDWGLFPWVRDTFDPARGNFGPKTYAKVCELLLRLNANYLCPAMHNCSMAFYRIPENKLVADSFGIVMGTSHCEPLFLNTATEWSKEYGPWNYETNKQGIDSVLRARVMETAPYEGVYTLALRGLHDVAMAGSNDLNERRDVMQRALKAQRSILTDVLKKKPEEIPQAFTPYKEVLDVYDRGLKLPDDVTIIWPDDNYGYMKRLSSPEEQKRSGRSGVYYHASYLGRPHDYTWMNTTSPTLMYEELRKAYDNTADRIWLLNAGDIKLCEPAVDFFLAMAYDIDSFNFQRAADYRAAWTSEMLNGKYAKELKELFREFYDLAFQRKPEAMGFGSQWTNDTHGREINADTEFSLTNYREAERRIARYQALAARAERIYRALPEIERACFFENVLYPVKGCELMNCSKLFAQRNRWYALQGRAATADYARMALQCHDSLNIITRQYDELLEGKWRHVVALRQEGAAAYYEKPEVRTAQLEPKATLGISVENEDVLRGKSGWHELPCFNKYVRRTAYIDLYNKSLSALSWNAAASASWIRLSATKGTLSKEQRVEVDIDWTKVPSGDRVTGTIDIHSNGGSEKVLVSVFNPAMPTLEEIGLAFVETNGYLSIPATAFTEKKDKQDFPISIVPNLGAEGQSVQLGTPMSPLQFASRRDAPYVEYNFYSFSQGPVDVYTYVLPTFTPCKDRGYAGHERTNIETHYGVMIDAGTRILEGSSSSFEYAQNWYDSVLRNCRINKLTLNVARPGWHKLRVIAGDGGIILQKVVLDFGGLQRSYMGPQPTLAGSGKD